MLSKGNYRRRMKQDAPPGRFAQGSLPQSQYRPLTVVPLRPLIQSNSERPFISTEDYARLHSLEDTIQRAAKEKDLLFRKVILESQLLKDRHQILRSVDRPVEDLQWSSFDIARHPVGYSDFLRPDR